MTSPRPHKDSTSRDLSAESTGPGLVGAGQCTPLLDMEEVARWLCTTVRHVQRLVTERRIPYVKVGHFVRFDPADVASWIEDQKVDGRPERPDLPVTIASLPQVAPTAVLTRRPTSATEVLARWKAQSR